MTEISEGGRCIHQAASKKLEVPVRKIMMGVPLEKAVNVDSMEDPRAIDYFVDMAKRLAGT